MELYNPFDFIFDIEFFNSFIVLPNNPIDLVAPVDSFIIVLNIILCYNAYCGCAKSYTQWKSIFKIMEVNNSMDVIVIGIILLIILYFLSVKLSKMQEATLEKVMEPINKINNEYEEKLKKWCDANNVVFKENITKTSEIWVNQIPGYIWFSDKNIIFCPDSINCGNPIDIRNHVMLIEYENIKYYTKDGTISYTNQIVNNGKNISVSGAVVGGLIAGEAGAIIGSRKDMIKLDNITVKHDEIHTYIYFESNNEIKLADIKGNDFYQSILYLMPEKEYNYLLNQNNT